MLVTVGTLELSRNDRLGDGSSKHGFFFPFHFLRAEQSDGSKGMVLSFQSFGPGSWWAMAAEPPVSKVPYMCAELAKLTASVPGNVNSVSPSGPLGLHIHISQGTQVLLSIGTAVSTTASRT